MLPQQLGNAAFRPLQWEALTEVAEQKRDVLLTVATGGGKSLVYTLLGFLATRQRVVVVISPTIELMKSQLMEIERLVGRVPDCVLKAVALGTFLN